MDEELKQKIHDHLMDLNYTDLFGIIYRIADIDYAVVLQALGLDDD